MRASTAKNYFRRTIDSPVGALSLFASDAGLAAILWREDSGLHLPAVATIEAGDHPLIARTELQLREYFARHRQVFDVPLDFHGTAFQKREWAELLQIPYGQTRTYAQVAAAIGHPDAVRAVGAANGRNPISIVAPCHRVIGSNGTLTGFGGGLANKAKLLALECAQSDLFGDSDAGADLSKKRA